MREIVLVLVLFLLPATAWSDNSDIAAFNKAWQEYVAAEQSGDAGLRVETAARAAEAGKRIFTTSDEQLALVVQNYGVALSDSGDRENAVPVLEEALELGQAYYGVDGAGLIPILADLADAKARNFSPGPQFRLYKRALKIAEQSFGPNSVEFADLAFRASRNVYSMSLSDTAQKYMSDARDIYLSLPEPKTQNAALADYYLGKMEFSDQKYKKSSEYLERALTGLEEPGEANQALRLLTRGLLVQVYERRGLRDKATPHCIAIGRESQLAPDQELAPIVRVAPRYPSSMLRSGNQGAVDIEFTVDESGFVKDPVVLGRTVNGREKKGRSDFDEAALDAVKEFRYAPKFVDGEPVASTGMKTRITFKLE
ncbi:MAG: TonB family protein [Woeseiaceae bacterium]|nr:TonB family protein [Woeseiaceae bacterium]